MWCSLGFLRKSTELWRNLPIDFFFDFPISLSIECDYKGTFINDVPHFLAVLTYLPKGTFYSESDGEMWNRHIKVPKIVPGLLFPVSDMNWSNKMLNFTFFSANKINLFKARINRYYGYNQWFLSFESIVCKH